MPRFLDNPVWFDNNGTEVKGYNGSNIDGAIAMWDNTAKTIVFVDLFPSGSVIYNTNSNLTIPGWTRNSGLDIQRDTVLYAYVKN